MKNIAICASFSPLKCFILDAFSIVNNSSTIYNIHYNNKIGAKKMIKVKADDLWAIKETIKVAPTFVNSVLEQIIEGNIYSDNQTIIQY